MVAVAVHDVLLRLVSNSVLYRTLESASALIFFAETAVLSPPILLTDELPHSRLLQQ